MSKNSSFKLVNTNAKTFGFNFQTKSWSSLKKKKKAFERNPQKTLGIKANKNMAPKNALGPSFFTPLVSGVVSGVASGVVSSVVSVVVSGVVSGVVQASEHEVRKPVTLRSLQAEKEGEELFC